MDGYQKDVKRRIDELNRQLKPLEDGIFRVNKISLGSPKEIDESQELIKHLRGAIATYERILAEYGKDAS
jgi:predicted  nucleic acid-binding Zn-ribbon protein